ncbi:TolC family outer membrane protein [Jannaschia sp. Os4]|uniref:TolC family outer membrane protein n=1 Tax=Jannaschia sp. Os4 TaxID=2807617 RepID=UPI00193A4970|nr:TolC family outer membrane protein [Jannaschia sp. Os4]MBM2576739.1 TolC family outer membrane protein [Jannaschia sp. Os4]
MRRLTRALRATVAGAALLLGAAAAQAHSLTDSLVLAFDESQLLEEQRALLRANDEDVAIAVARLKPTLDFFASVSRSFSDPGTAETSAQLGITLNWLLADGGGRAFRIGASKEVVLAARWGLVAVEQQVLLNAATAHLNLRLARRVVEVRQSNVRLITQQLRAAEDRFEVGEVTRTDVALARSRLALARAELAAAQGDVEIAEEVYALAVGHRHDGGGLTVPAAPQLPPSLERAQALALQVNPNIRSLQHQVTAQRLLAEAAVSDRLPTISLNGSVTRSGPVAGSPATPGANLPVLDQFGLPTGNSVVIPGSPARSGGAVDNATIGLRADMPIYRGGALSAASRQARQRVSAVQAQLGQQGRVVSEGVGRAWAGLSIAQAQVTAFDQQVEAAQLAFEGFREEALLGARTTLDVLDAEQELLDARTARLQAATQVQIQVYTVLASIGLLTTEHLGLAVETYDPELYSRAVRTAPPVSPSPLGDKLDRVLRRYDPTARN